MGRDNGGMSNRYMIRGGSRGAMKACTHLGGGSSMGPGAIGSKTKEVAKTGTFEEIGFETIGLGAEEAPIVCRVTSCC